MTLTKTTINAIVDVALLSILLYDIHGFMLAHPAANIGMGEVAGIILLLAVCLAVVRSIAMIRVKQEFQGLLTYYARLVWVYRCAAAAFLLYPFGPSMLATIAGGCLLDMVFALQIPLTAETLKFVNSG
jgi:hypothetical protein